MSFSWEDVERGFKSTGFLAEECVEFRRYYRELFSDWFKLAEGLNRLGHSLHLNAIDLLDERPARDAISLGIRMFPRGLSHLQAAILLAERGLGIEAQSHVRAVYETAFWIGFLEKEPSIAVREFEARDQATWRRHFQRIVSEESFIPADLKAAALSQLNKMGKETNKIRQLETDKIAKRAGLKKSYLFYSDLSGSAVHVSLTQILSQLADDKDNVLHGPVIGANHHGVEKAISLACHAILDAISGLAKLTRFDERNEIRAAEQKLKDLDARNGH